ncbi:MAG: hypothetical protein KGI39_03945, partial [Patescibacteria group bacterium]|nr:hypothetical protein [Patescibacteria group bacterium]
MFRDVENFFRKWTGIIITCQLKTEEEHILNMVMDKDVSVSELKRNLKMDADKISRILRSLRWYQKGKKKFSLINENHDPKDARRRVVSITRQGMKILEIVSSEKEQKCKEFFGCLS